MRRSWLLVRSAAEATGSDADVVVLDLAGDLGEAPLRPGGSWARPASSAFYIRIPPGRSGMASLEQWWGRIDGVVLAAPESADVVCALAGRMDQLDEPGRGRKQLVVSIETARGHAGLEEILQSCRRISGVTAGFTAERMCLGLDPDGQRHLMRHLLQRLVMYGAAYDATAIGPVVSASSGGDTSAAERLIQWMAMAGIAGAFCAGPDLVPVVNASFGRPTGPTRVPCPGSVPIARCVPPVSRAGPVTASGRSGLSDRACSSRRAGIGT
jgi:hypothetical protein